MEQHQEQKEQQEPLKSKQDRVDAEQVYQTDKIGSMAAKFVYMGLQRLQEEISESLGQPVTLEDAADFIECNIGEFTFDMLDDIISNDFKISLIVNSSLRLAGAVLSYHNGWREELLNNRGDIVLKMAKLYRSDVYDIFSVRPNLLNFFTDYLIYKFRLH